MQQQPKPKQRGSNTWIIFAVAAVAVLAYGIWQGQDDEDPEPPARPSPSVPGANRLIDVVTALEDAGLNVEIIRSSFRSPQLSVPGQGLEVDGEPMYVFIYTGRDAVGARDAESKDLDPATVTVNTVSGTPVAEGDTHVVFNSNVIAIMPSTSQETMEKVDEAIQGLP